MGSAAGLDWGSLLQAPGSADLDACFLLSTTALGQTWVLLEQHVLHAALEVYAADPFPGRPAGWPALLEGALADLLGPRDLYSLSYFLTDETRRWGARISACRALAEEARAFRAGRGAGVAQMIAACGESRLSRRAAWRCLAACDPLAGPTAGALWLSVSLAIAAGRVRAQGTAAELDLALDAGTALGTHPPLPPLPALPPGASGPVLAAVTARLALAREELESSGPALAAAALDRRPASFRALTPLALAEILETDAAQVWCYAWARRQFRGEAALLVAVETALRASGRAVPGDPRRAA